MTVPKAAIKKLSQFSKKELITAISVLLAVGGTPAAAAVAAAVGGTVLTLGVGFAGFAKLEKESLEKKRMLLDLKCSLKKVPIGAIYLKEGMELISDENLGAGTYAIAKTSTEEATEEATEGFIKKFSGEFYITIKDLEGKNVFIESDGEIYRFYKREEEGAKKYLAAAYNSLIQYVIGVELHVIGVELRKVALFEINDKNDASTFKLSEEDIDAFEKKNMLKEGRPMTLVFVKVQSLGEKGFQSTFSGQDTDPSYFRHGNKKLNIKVDKLDASNLSTEDFGKNNKEKKFKIGNIQYKFHEVTKIDSSSGDVLKFSAWILDFRGRGTNDKQSFKIAKQFVEEID